MRAAGYRILIFFLSLPFIASAAPPTKGSANGTRINFGPVISFYKVNPNHAREPSQKMSILAGFRREIRIDRDYQSYLQIGFDYFLHGVNFHSYYFKPDSIHLYDKSFGYTYSLLIHELNLPVQVKYLFWREDNSVFSPYVIAGYHFRYLLPASLKITQSGNLVESAQPEMKFRTHLINERMNAFVSAGLGWQRNNLSGGHGSFFVELNYRFGFSSYYFEAPYAPSSLYISGSHLSLQLGLKF
jgi:hypothetical protein